MLTIGIVMAERVSDAAVTQADLDALRLSGRVIGPQPGFDGLDSADVLVTGWGCPPVDDAVLAAMPRLRAIVHAAGSVKSHVTEACWDRGIAVSSAASANAIPVAEFTLAMILLVNKGALRFIRGAAPGTVPVRGNRRTTVGIVGASRVGRRVLELLAPFEHDVLLHDPLVAAEQSEALRARVVPLDELLAASQVVSLHAPALPETRHLMDARRLALMPDGAALINTARGSLVDTDALVVELRAGRLEAVLDVTDPEPLPDDHPLRALPTAHLTPHVAGSLGPEIGRMTALAIEEVARFARGEPFAHQVDRARLAVIA